MSRTSRASHGFLRIVLAVVVTGLVAACRPGEPEVVGSARFAEALPVDAVLTVRLVPEHGDPDAPLFELRDEVPAGSRRHEFVLPYDAAAADGARYALRGRVDGDGLLWLGEGGTGLQLDPRGLRTRIRLAAP